KNLILPTFDQAGNLCGDIPSLNDLIDKVLSGPNRHTTLDGHKTLGLDLHDLLSVEILGPASDPSAWRNAVDILQPALRLSDLLLAAKLLIEIRNKLTHGTVYDNQPHDHEVVVLNHEEQFCVRLTLRSLEQCFRLLVVLLNAFHNEEDMDEKDVWWAARTW